MVAIDSSGGNGTGGGENGGGGGGEVNIRSDDVCEYRGNIGAGGGSTAGTPGEVWLDGIQLDLGGGAGALWPRRTEKRAPGCGRQPGASSVPAYGRVRPLRNEVRSWRSATCFRTTGCVRPAG